MTNRILSKEEIERNEKSIRLLLEEITDKRYVVKYKTLFLEEGIEYQRQKEIAKCEKELAETDSEYMKKYLQLMLDEGIDINIKRIKAQAQADIRDAESIIRVDEKTIKILNRQNTEGVESIQPTEELNEDK